MPYAYYRFDFADDAADAILLIFAPPFRHFADAFAAIRHATMPRIRLVAAAPGALRHAIDAMLLRFALLPCRLPPCFFACYVERCLCYCCAMLPARHAMKRLACFYAAVYAMALLFCFCSLIFRFRYVTPRQPVSIYAMLRHLFRQYAYCRHAEFFRLALFISFYAITPPLPRMLPRIAARLLAYARCAFAMALYAMPPLIRAEAIMPYARRYIDFIFMFRDATRYPLLLITPMPMPLISLLLAAIAALMLP